jgi:hypothetical protein
MLQARTIDHQALGTQVPEGNVFGNPESKTFKEMAGKAGEFNLFPAPVSMLSALRL